MSEARHAPAAARNREPILEVLRRVLPREGRVLEIASGTGEHAVFFAAALPDLVWIPTDADPNALPSIAAHRDLAAAPNVEPPRLLDTQEPWPLEPDEKIAALVAINVIHISPWEATLALFEGAARVLPSGAPLVTYGPYAIDGAHTAPSNEAFDASLRARDPRWGVRDLNDVTRVAKDASFELEERVAMPANNFTLVFRRR